MRMYRIIRTIAVVLAMLVGVECVYLFVEYRKQWDHDNWTSHPNSLPNK